MVSVVSNVPDVKIIYIHLEKIEKKKEIRPHYFNIGHLIDI